jgi:hypothetical protein
MDSNHEFQGQNLASCQLLHPGPGSVKDSGERLQQRGSRRASRVRIPTGHELGLNPGNSSGGRRARLPDNARADASSPAAELRPPPRHGGELIPRQRGLVLAAMLVASLAVMPAVAEAERDARCNGAATLCDRRLAAGCPRSSPSTRSRPAGCSRR